MSEPRRWFIHYETEPIIISADSIRKDYESLDVVRGPRNKYIEVIAVEDHDRIVADLKAEVERLKEVIQHDVDKVEAAYSETIARQAKVIEKYQQAVTRIWVSSDNCEHDMEPNTTMDFFRCEKCGIPSAFAAIEQGEGM